MSPKIQGLIAICLASLLWSTAGVAAKWLVAGIPPLVATFYRFGIASLLILPVFLATPKPKDLWRKLFPMSLLAAANVILFYLGIKTTTANSATLVYSATPLATAVLAAIILREQISRLKLTGISLGFLGILLIIALPGIKNAQFASGNLWGNLLIFIAMLMWTIYSIYLKRVLAQPQYTPLLATGVLFFATTITSFLVALVTKQSFVTPQLFTLPFLSVLLYTSIFITLITFLLFQWAVQRISIVTASLKNYLEPVLAIWLNFLLLGETINLGFVAGSILVILGVVIATYEMIRSRKR